MILTILISKLISRLLRFFGKGATTLPGRVALSMKYNILNRLCRGVNIICVTGTNGKTTTCALIEHALKKLEKSYFINKSGANMISGVATAFIMNCNIFGRCKKEYAILECDENSLPEISRYIDAKIVAVTNIFRDQLDRYGELDSALNSIVSGINNMPDALLVLNADCPITYSISEKCENKIYPFGVNANCLQSAVSESHFCPVCGGELVYKSRVYAQLGDFYCAKCGYKRVFPELSISDISENEGVYSFVVNRPSASTLSSSLLGGIYNIYNFACAFAVLDLLGLYDSALLSDFSGAFGRMEHFKCGDNEILLLLVKNPVGFSNCISYASKLSGEYNYVFALNDNEADGCDVSWIWDTSFDALSGRGNKVFTVGRRSFDMALRLKYDGVSVFSSIDGEDYNSLIRIIREENRNFIVFANYTAMMNMRKFFIEAFGGKEFWE